MVLCHSGLKWVWSLWCHWATVSWPADDIRFGSIFDIEFGDNWGLLPDHPCYCTLFDSFAPGICRNNLKSVIFRLFYQYIEQFLFYSQENAAEFLWWEANIWSGDALVPLKKQVIILANVNPDLCRHDMASLGHNELTTTVIINRGTRTDVTRSRMSSLTNQV